MVDGKNLSSFVSKRLADLSYETMVKIYDSNCDGCPFASIRITKTTETYGRRTLQKLNNLDEAIKFLMSITNLGNMNYNMHRECTYGGEELTLTEIVHNTCRFWKIETCEGGQNEIEPSFIEVESTEEVKVEHNFPAI